MNNKAIILGVILVFGLLFSCSDDDDSTGPVEPVDRMLSQIHTRFLTDGIESSRVEESFLSGQPYIRYTYEGSTVVSKVEYKYNSRGSVENLKYYYDTRYEEKENFLYDAKNRLIEFYAENVLAPEMNYYREFEYPSDTIIIEQQRDYQKNPLPGGRLVYTLNEAGLIYKVRAENGDLFTAEYDANQILSVNTPTDGVYNYTYDELNLDQGDFYKKYYQSIYGTDVNNAALYFSSLLDIPQVYSDKFLLSATSESMMFRYDYTLDVEGYPIERADYDQMVQTAVISYIYE